MEKFGIFELLDTLSALTAREQTQEPSQKQGDASYLPPSYGGTAAETPAAPAPTAKAEQDALAGFLARHDAVAKKAEKKQP